jgi:small ligand-binding sensory domain FIST
MRFACGVSRAERYEPAVAELVAALAEGLAGARPDLVCLFVSPHHESAWLSLAERLRREFPAALLFGCTARSVIGAASEIEEAPGIAVSAAALPGVRLQPFHVGDTGVPELPGPDDAHVLLLVDPFSASRAAPSSAASQAARRGRAGTCSSSGRGRHARVRSASCSPATSRSTPSSHRAAGRSARRSS